MISAFLSAASDLLGFIMLPSPPVLVVDMAHAAISSLIAQMTMDVDEVILFRVQLRARDQKISGSMFIFLDAGLLEKIAARLREMVAG